MKTDGNVALIKDHHEALGIWRKRQFKDLSLVHIDAHIDFGFHPAKTIHQIINESQSTKDLKRDLEYALLFKRFQTDLDTQINIGNYIYPAMREGIVRDFYWVVPGRHRKFRQSYKELRNIIRILARQDPYKSHLNKSRLIRHTLREGLVKTKLLGRRFIICTLDSLPNLKDKILLDIDTDFLIGKEPRPSMIVRRKPWIYPKEFVDILQKKIKNPVFTTIAYSVNGGFTPMEYQYLGDEIAYCLAPWYFNRRYKRNLRAAEYFNLFNSTGKKEYYYKASGLNPTYRSKDNNYGPLYLNLRRFSKAEREFTKIIRVDPKNPYALSGLGKIYLQKEDYYRSKGYFSSALKEEKDLDNALLGLAQIEFKMNNLTKAKMLLKRYQALKPMHSSSYALLGDVYQREKRYREAAIEYKNAASLSESGTLDILIKLLKINKHIGEKDDILRYVVIKYRDFRKRFYRTKRSKLRVGNETKYLRKMQERMRRVRRLVERQQWDNLSEKSRGNGGQAYERERRFKEEL